LGRGEASGKKRGIRKLIFKLNSRRKSKKRGIRKFLISNQI
jgi:hypothetical protein